MTKLGFFPPSLLLVALLCVSKAGAQAPTPSPVGNPSTAAPQVADDRWEFDGEYEVKLDYRRNFALDRPARDDLFRFDQELQLRWSYAFNDWVSVFFEGKMLGEHQLYTGGGGRRSDASLERGESWLRWENLFGKDLTLKVGRQNFDEPRQWWWDDDLDALALRYRRESFSLELGIARQVAQVDLLRSRIEPEEEGVLRVLSRANWRYTTGHAVNLFFLYNRDSSSTPAVGTSVRASREDDSDANLWWGGLRASGRELVGGLGELSYWADLAVVAGREKLLEFDDAPGQRKLVTARKRQSVYGRAIDAGVRLATELPGRPIFTLTYAVGSGDRDPERGTDRSFRQTGLQSNDEEFRTYGEILRPELANLRIPAVAVGFPLLAKSYIEFAFRNFRQVYAAPFVRDSRIEVEPDGIRKNIGNEWMLSSVLKEWRKFEIEIVGAAFKAGRAYGAASGSMAYSFFTQLTYLF